MTQSPSNSRAGYPDFKTTLERLRPILTSRRALILLGALVLSLGAALNWGWLVALGIAPFILSAAPCLVMCGLGHCMSNGARKNKTTAAVPAPALTSQQVGDGRDSSGNDHRAVAEQATLPVGKVGA